MKVDMMNEVVSILTNEKERLKSCVGYAQDSLQSIYQPALVQRTATDSKTGEQFTVDYIDIDKFSPEQKERFDNCSNFCKQQRAKLAVFENFVKGLVPKETIMSYDEYVTPLEEFNGVSLSCNDVYLNRKGEISDYSIKVGPINVKSKESMSFDEYKQLYTSSLGNFLVKTLGQGLTQEQAMQQLQTACSEVYLAQKKSPMSL